MYFHLLCDSLMAGMVLKRWSIEVDLIGMCGLGRSFERVGMDGWFGCG